MKSIIGMEEFKESKRYTMNTDEHLEFLEAQLKVSIHNAETDLEAANESNYKSDASDAKRRIKNLKKALGLVESSHKLY